LAGSAITGCGFAGVVTFTLSVVGADTPRRLTGCTGSVRAGATDLTGGEGVGGASVIAFRATGFDAEPWLSPAHG